VQLPAPSHAKQFQYSHLLWHVVPSPVPLHTSQLSSLQVVMQSPLPLHTSHSQTLHVLRQAESWQASQASASQE
jgi:hypothetical protein